MSTLQPLISRLAAACAAILLLSACRSMPTVPPAEAAAEIGGKLAAGETKAADSRWSEIRTSEEHREVTFSILYAQARTRYDQEDYEAAARFLRFLDRHYPRAGAPKEALLYTLFLERARAGKPGSADEVATEMDRLVSAVRKRDGSPPVWIDLVAAQTAVDRGRHDVARAALARFHAGWDGSPSTLRPYVEEMDRYLATHREDTP